MSIADGGPAHHVLLSLNGAANSARSVTREFDHRAVRSGHAFPSSQWGREFRTLRDSCDASLGFSAGNSRDFERLPDSATNGGRESARFGHVGRNRLVFQSLGPRERSSRNSRRSARRSASLVTALLSIAMLKSGAESARSLTPDQSFLLLHFPRRPKSPASPSRVGRVRS